MTRQPNGEDEVVKSTRISYREAVSTSELSKGEIEIWHAWKRATEAVTAQVGRDITEETGLSGADYGVLSRLVDLGGGELRQQELANEMGWDKSRLSHHLTRMEEREMVVRKKADGTAVKIAITAAGKRALKTARPVHARAVRKALVSRVPKDARVEILGFLTGLVEEG